MNAGTTKIVAIAVVAVVVVAGAAAAVALLNNKEDKKLYDGMTWDEMLEKSKGSTVTLGQFPDTYLLNYYSEYIIPQAKELGITVKINSTSYGDVGANSVINSGENAVDAFWGPVSAYTLLTSGEKNYTLMDNWVSYLPNSKYVTDNQYSELRYTYEASHAGEGDKATGTAMPLSSGFTALTFNENVNAREVNVYYNVMAGYYAATTPVTKTLAYNQVAIIDYVYTDRSNVGYKIPAGDYEGLSSPGYRVVGTIFVTEDGDANGVDFPASKADIKYVEAGGSPTYYKISTVHAALKTTGSISKEESDSSVSWTTSSGTEKTTSVKTRAITGLYGLPSNYAELANWVKIYPGVFTYCTPSTGNAWFHGYMFLQGAMYELTWKDATNHTGWQTVKDAEAAAASAGTKTKWQEAGLSYSSWLDKELSKINPSMSASATSDEAYMDLVGYAYTYLSEIEPNLYKGGTAAAHAFGNIAAVTALMVQDDKDWSANNTLMCSFSSIGAISMRLGTTTGISSSYTNITPGVYMMETSVMDYYYFFINGASKNIVPTLVVLNLFLSPENQEAWYRYNGNLFNIDTESEYKNADGKTVTVGETMDSLEYEWSVMDKVLARDLASGVSTTYISYKDIKEGTIDSNITIWLPHLQWNWTKQYTYA